MSNKKFISEVLPVSGITVSATASAGEFELSICGEKFYLTKSDINRLHGIAFPEKIHGCCQVVNNNGSVGEQTNIENSNSPITL